MDAGTADEERGERSQNDSNVFGWHQIGHSIKDKASKKPRKLLDNVIGQCRSGSMLAILGPSGAGKSTMLDCLAGRKALHTGRLSWNGDEISQKDLAPLNSYVEQSDALIGTLTVYESFWFATRLSFPRLNPTELKERVDSIVAGLGLGRVASNRIGTPIQRGISGGQKRRVTIGTSLASRPSILFLDEPTSGLDSATSYEVMSTIKQMALQHGIIVVATIHSPSWDTICLFDNALLLAQGQVAYSGPVQSITSWFESIGYPVKLHSNPADHMMNLVSSDFDDEKLDSVHRCLAAWSRRHETEGRSEAEADGLSAPTQTGDFAPPAPPHPHQVISTSLTKTWCLVKRNFLNYNRNLLAYGVRLAMYIGMGVLVATVWVNLPLLDSRINDRLSVHFFSVAFLGFMSVAGIPSFLEEREVLLREKRNGLYGTLPFVLAHTAVNLPYLFFCSLAYAIIIYWSIGLHPGGSHFFRFLAFMFLGVYAAETQSLLIAALIPNFVASLAIAAFVNGFWMAVQGYFMRNLPSFWRSWAHWIDYETYAFQLLVKSDFAGLSFAGDSTADACSCTFAAPVLDTCSVSGDEVISTLGYSGSSAVLYAFIIVVIILIYRLAFWGLLAWQR